MPSTLSNSTLAVFLVALAWPAAPALASLGDPTDKIYPNDAQPYHDFGRAVAIDGDRAIVGAIGDDTNGSISGAVYVFDSITGDQLDKLVANDGESLDRFGSSLALEGNIALIGAAFDDEADVDSGSAYLFDISTGQQLHKLVPNDGVTRDYFGTSVGLCGNLAVVGAPSADHNGAESGAVYFFDVSTGQQIRRWTPSDGKAGDYFGQAVDTQGNFVIAGAPYYDTSQLSNRGTAYVFDLNLDLSLGHLHPLDPDTGDVFGFAVALQGDTALVTAAYDDEGGRDAGAAYLFDLTTGDQILKMRSNDGAAYDRLGGSARISGTTAVVGCQFDDDAGSDSGSAYLFDMASGQQIDKLLPGDGARDDWFGSAVGISGGTVIVGSYHDDDFGTSSGAAYLFDSCPEDLVFSASPALAFAGDEMHISTFGGVPGLTNLVVVVAIDGVPQFLRITRGQFDPECKHSLVATVPAGLAGLDVTFAAVGFAASGLQLSNASVVSFQ